MLTFRCVKSLAKGGFTGQVKDGHLVGRNLHSLFSCNSMLASLQKSHLIGNLMAHAFFEIRIICTYLKGHPETLNLHLVLPERLALAKLSLISSSSLISFILSNLWEYFVISRFRNWLAKSKHNVTTWVGFNRLRCRSSSELGSRCKEVIPVSGQIVTAFLAEPPFVTECFCELLFRDCSLSSLSKDIVTSMPKIEKKK